MTFAWWAYWDAYSDTDATMLASGSPPTGGIYIAPNASGVGSTGYLQCVGDDTSGAASTYVRAGVSAAAWHQYIFQCDLTPGGGVAILLWVDNVSVSLTSLVANPTAGNFTNDTLAVMGRAAGTEFAAGRMQALAVYSGTLTAGQKTLLQTQAPNKIGKAPLNYWPLNGTVNPEPAAIGGVAMTIVGATFVANGIMFKNPNLTTMGVGE
jgi:hypothetical protein